MTETHRERQRERDREIRETETEGKRTKAELGRKCGSGGERWGERADR